MRRFSERCARYFVPLNASCRLSTSRTSAYDLDPVLAAVHRGGGFGRAALRLVELGARGGGFGLARDGLGGEPVDVGLDRRDLGLDVADLGVEPGDRGVELAAPAADLGELAERGGLVGRGLADRLLQLARPRVVR